MKRKLSCILTLFCILSCVSGCSTKENAEAAETVKIVKTEPVKEGNVTTGYSYIGIVKAKETKNYSFLASGKIAEISVEKGQSFKAGDLLARLDTTSMQYQEIIGENTKTQAEAALEKTISTYDTNISNASSQIESLETAIAAGEKGIEALEIGLEAELKNIDAGEKGIEALKIGLNAEQENIKAGQNALETLKSQLEGAEKVNAAGAYPDMDLKILRSTYETKQAELETAKAAHEGNKAALESKLAELEASKAAHEGNKAELESKKAELESKKAQRTEALKTLDNLYTSKSKDVAAAQASISSAGISNDIVRKNINDAEIRADSDGYVMELPFKEGEVISAGYPVVVAKSSELVVTIGASDSEYKDIKIGGKVLINGEETGVVETISQYPDEKNRTYAVDIAVQGNYSIGETVNVKIITGNANGCYVPITAVFNSDGVDYVYVVNSENRIYKKQVVLGEFSGDKVEVQIDDVSAVVVTEGIKKLRENDLVEGC